MLPAKELDLASILLFNAELITEALESLLMAIFPRLEVMLILPRSA